MTTAATTSRTIPWSSILVEQIDWHWTNHLRPRFDGLTDDEYFWQPTPGAWTVHPRGTGGTKTVGGSGEFTVDFEYPEPVPAPVTTIAWRLAHLIVGIFGARAASHFGGPPIDYFSHAYAGNAGDALRQLDAGYARWIDGVRSLDEERSWAPIGEAEGDYAELPYAALVQHINREVIHHGAEILLLRDLYRVR